MAAWQSLATTFGRPGLVPPDGNERLCAVCLTKRIAPETQAIQRALGGPAPDFPSTSSLATLAFRRSLAEKAGTNAALGNAVDRFLDALGGWAPYARAYGATVEIDAGVFPSLRAHARQAQGEARARAERLLRFDGEWLLRETYARWRTTLRQGSSEPAADRALAEAEGALGNLLYEARSLGMRPPSAFYAVLLLDGDRMGRWVSGEAHRVALRDLLHPDVRAALEPRGEWSEALAARRLFTPSTHAALGSILRNFAQWSVPESVEQEADGRVVYAGGDDVLALLPVEQALRVLDALRRRYQAAFLCRATGGKLYGDAPPRPRGDAVVFRGMGPDATVSAGLLFAHHLYPLGLALEEARRLEHEAKERGGRDAVAVGVARRSGPEPDVELVSKYERGGRSLPGLLETARALLAQDAGEAGVAGRLAYQLRTLATTLDNLPDAGARRSAVGAVAARQSEDAAGRELLLRLYDALAAPLPSKDGSERPASQPVASLVACLRLARFLEAEV